LRWQVNVFLDDMANFAEMNGMYEQYFSHKPARSCVAVKQLPKGVPVEIECIAYTGMSSKLWGVEKMLMMHRLDEYRPHDTGRNVIAWLEGTVE
jgi:hypothetical protein